eukprot:CAMPEP_0196131202 /NCGR_PEP_ID=MMETSP0910-20130528/1308_1 /TAXON_ID=49265 /ORGANISM="Thalassiosira rotula, Strain GSO102" /LENGTH=67 /DNA_ID=CAMNT_0041390649 /DNA_START=271 /DNA_END=474 /DNA_ORIENTATION=+
MSFLSDLEAQMKDVFSTQPITKDINVNNKVLNKRLSMQKKQGWILRQKILQPKGNERTTGDYDGEFC